MERVVANVQKIRKGEGTFQWTGKVAAAITAALPAYFVWEWLNTKHKVKLYKDEIGDKVYMDIGIGNKYAGRILIGLYTNRVPLTCENFLQLCKGYQVRDKLIGYRNTQFHMIKPASCLVGGDVLLGTGKSRGMSIYGESFPDENFDMEFLRDGDLCMTNWGKNTNSSHFMITLSSQRVWYGHHVVFGTVLKGMRVVRECGELSTKVGKPVMPIRILQCGVFDEDGEMPPPPQEFVAKVGPVMSEDDFRAEMEERKKSAQQPS